jgi:long-subunit fatty acid transport protein
MPIGKHIITFIVKSFKKETFRMLKRLVFISLSFNAPSLFAECQGNFFQTNAEIGLERSQLTGDIKVGDAQSSRVDIKDDLGINHSTAGLKAMLSRATTHHKFGFKLEKYEHSGSKKLSSNILYNGSSYATASLISSKVSLKWAKIKYRYRYNNKFSFGVDMNGMRLKTMINENESKELLLLPALGVDYEKELEEGLNFIAKGSSSITGDSNYHYAYTGFSYAIKYLDCSCLHIGYQYKSLAIKTDKMDANLKYQGLYAGIAMKF